MFDFNSFYEIIEKNSSFVITTHINPDGDAIGSAMALFYFLRSFNKTAHVINYSKTPKYYKFLDSDNVIIHFNEEDKKLLNESDVIFFVDLNETSRIKSMAPFVLESKATRVMIDHHERSSNLTQCSGLPEKSFIASPFNSDEKEPSSKRFADIEFVDSKACSTGEIMYKLISHKYNSLIDQKIAQALYAAIMTDTQSFHLPHTTSEVYRISADLIDKGASPGFIYKQIYESNHPNRIILLSEFLSQMKLVENNRIVYFVVTQEMFCRTETKEEDIDNFITYGLQIETAEIVILFVQLDDGIKISFRSIPPIPINNLAKEFGGNGHKNAAGVRLTNSLHGDVSLETMIPKLLESAKKYLV